MPRQFNIAEAKARLSELVEAASRGEEIVLARHGKPMARIAALADGPKAQRKFGQDEKYARHIDWDQWWRDWKAADREIEADFEASELFPPGTGPQGPAPAKPKRKRRVTTGGAKRA